MSSLPSSSNAPAVEVFAIPTGQLTHPDRWLFEDGDDDLLKARSTYPDYSFLIRHPLGKNILFDLGLRKDLENVPVLIQAQYKYIEPLVTKDIVELLEEGPVLASSISTVVLSHIHFDHVGDPNKFPDAVLLAGPGSKAVSGVGWPRDPLSPFLSSVTEHPHYRELSFETDAWAPWGPFARAHDFFGDGSFYLIDTPGHLPGHMGGVAFTGPDEWVVMGGDCCHHRSLLMHTRPMSVTCGPAGEVGFHLDPDSAKRTLGTIRKLENESGGNVLIALAHDSYLRGRMPEYPTSLNGFKASEWKKDLDRVLQKDYSTA